ncbi:MAG TPA: PilZ domain-containing protein, partial [Polyangiaceae bacterium]
MTNPEERRADGIQRVPVEAMVEVCGVGGKQTPFEAESADVSGRGIRLRTAYLPDSGAPVVCRFENAGREVIAEGVVAWAQKEARGGEFGVRFTALDARSADTLRELCGLDGAAPADIKVELPATAPSHAKVVPGAKVKLHIEGLGSPMRARVDEGKGGHLSVGSSLEFLRIGRKLEVESIDDGSRREARIDGLDVMIDPSTGVPRLVVLLKTSNDENTPQPSVVDAARRAASSGSSAKARDAAPSRPASGEARAKSSSKEPDEPTDEQIDAMMGRARRIAGATRRKMSEVSVQLGSQLGPGLLRALRGFRQLSRRPTEPPRRRTTAAPTANASNADRKLRPQNRASTPDVAPSVGASKLLSPRAKRVAGGVVAAGLLTTVIVVAMQQPDASKTSRSASVDARPNLSVGNANAAPASTLGVAAGQVTPGTAASGSSLNVPVPLFGNTSMATMERPPLSPSPEESSAAIAAREQALAKATQAAVAAGHDMAKLSEEPNASSA